jgi:hypothetical protein
MVAELTAIHEVHVERGNLQASLTKLDRSFAHILRYLNQMVQYNIRTSNKSF